MAELADALGLEPSALCGVGVRLPPDVLHGDHGVAVAPSPVKGTARVRIPLVTLDSEPNTWPRPMRPLPFMIKVILCTPTRQVGSCMVGGYPTGGPLRQCL